jgi:hypothetical protein
MSQATDADIQALIAEMKNLRADFARIGDIIRTPHATAPRRRRRRFMKRPSKAGTTPNQGAVDPRRDRTAPLQSALTIFGIGMLLGS